MGNGIRGFWSMKFGKKDFRRVEAGKVPVWDKDVTKNSCSLFHLNEVIHCCFGVKPKVALELRALVMDLRGVLGRALLRRN